jgi:hypothetical protein
MLSIICEPLEISLKAFFNEGDFKENSFPDDPLLESIYKLNATQREKLKQFLDSII